MSAPGLGNNAPKTKPMRGREIRRLLEQSSSPRAKGHSAKRAAMQNRSKKCSSGVPHSRLSAMWKRLPAVSTSTACASLHVPLAKEMELSPYHEPYG